MSEPNEEMKGNETKQDGELEYVRPEDMQGILYRLRCVDYGFGFSNNRR